MRIATAVITFVTLISTGASPATLVVDDFPTEVDWHDTWLDALSDADLEATVISSDDIASHPAADVDLVLWNCGNVATAPLSTPEREWISALRAGGGNLLLCAPGLPAQMYEASDHAWLMENLGCDYVFPDSSITWGSVYRGFDVVGLTGTPLEGLSASLEFGPEAEVPADGLCVVHTTDDRAIHLAALPDLHCHLGVARETPKDRTVFLSFPVDSVQPRTARGEILGRCIEWLARPRFEGRGVWIVRNQLTDPNNIDHIVDACAEAGFNTLFVQVRGRGDAFYSSATEPRAEALADLPEDFDPLQRFIDRARPRGLEVHAWLNAGYTWLPEGLPEDPGHVVNENPEWIMVNRSGRSLMDYASVEFEEQYMEGRYLSLAAPVVQDYLTQVYLEVAENYDIDGLHFDFIRYCTRGVSPEYDLDYNPLVLEAFEAEHGFNPLDIELDSDRYWIFRRWQMDRIGELVGRIRDEAHAVKPGIRVSAAVLSRYPLARAHATQDWIAWLQRGQLDTACIMDYSRDNHLVVQEALVGQENRGQGTIWVGMSTRGAIDTVVERIEMVRSIVDPEGIMFFAWGGFDEAELERLRSDPFVAPALVPPVD